MNTKWQWKEISFREALAYAATRTPSDERVADIYQDAAVLFTDGTALKVVSEWSGPSSEVTPDTDADPPTFWIGSQ